MQYVVTGRIPETIGDLSQLDRLWLEGNVLTGSSRALSCKATRAQNITCWLWVCNVDQVRFLSRLVISSVCNRWQCRSAACQVRGHMSTVWLIARPYIPNKKFDRAHVHFFRRTGYIPSSVGGLTNLQHLSLEQNNLTGGSAQRAPMIVRH